MTGLFRRLSFYKEIHLGGTRYLHVGGGLNRFCIGFDISSHWISLDLVFVWVSYEF